MLLYGKPLMEKMEQELSARAAALTRKGTPPTLAVVRVGADPAAENYVASILRRSACVGVAVQNVAIGADEEALRAAMTRLACDRGVHGILLCLPLPETLRGVQEEIKAMIPPEKDVDGITSGSAAGVFLDTGVGYAPCTAEASMRLLEHYATEFSGKRACVVGRSAVIGKPAAMMLLRRNATVTVCHSRTEELAAETSRADIVIACAGSAGLLGAKHVKPGARVIDVGANWDASMGKIVGDVLTQEVLEAGAEISPVPGGVGGITAMVLMEHVICAAEALQPLDND